MALLAAYAVPHPPLIIPTVGRGEERKIQATIDAYKEVGRRIAEHNPDTVVVISPHAPLYNDAFFISGAQAAYGDMARFRAPQTTIDVRCDTELAEQIAANAQDQYDIPIVDSDGNVAILDHGTFIPLYFIGDALQSMQLVRMGFAGLNATLHEEMGHCITQAAEQLGRRIVVIASGDLSHKLKSDGPYGFAPEGPEFDKDIERIFKTGNLPELFVLDSFMCDAAAECGLRSFWIMAGALDGTVYSAELLSHEGPFGVGYAVACFEIDGGLQKELDEDAEEIAQE